MNEKKDNILHLPVLIEQDEDNIYIVSCPAFKGCHSFGKTIEEALSNIMEVIQLCMDEQKDKAKRYQSFNRFIGFRELQLPINSPGI
ncbi:MAG: type II toxin-antitoxin system HicB family antitoxin [Bacteroidetes bacterium]|nr:type II toxin-antitoxin system HicB family antitoxin [Bacteroidota bacterium]